MATTRVKSDKTKSGWKLKGDVLFDEVAPKYKERNGGYTRVIKMGRTSAGRDEAVIEYVE